MKQSATELATLLIAIIISANAAGMDASSKHRMGPPPFEALDLDGSGGISLSEFEQHEIPRGDHASIFINIDADGDGVITERELFDHKPPRPSKQGPNHN